MKSRSLVGLGIVLLFAGALWLIRHLSSPMSPGMASTPATAQHREARPQTPIAAPPVIAPQAILPPSDEEIPNTVTSQPVESHQHHDGKACAYCLAEQKLAPCRSDYAQLQFELINARYQIPKEQVAPIQAACQQLADRLIREWSFSESKPVLPPDSTVDSMRDELLKPLLSRLTLSDPTSR